MQFNFYNPDEVSEDKLDVVVIIAFHDGKRVFCRHKNRSTWELPGGHIEKGENADEAAHRELWEETGALDFELKAICICCDEKYNGMIYTAEIKEFGSIPTDSEMAEIHLFDCTPEKLTYTEFYEALFQYIKISDYRIEG